ncbi:sigma-54-dependent transcriptional regulator [Sandaracinus amylolyticus]|uniref:Response regulator of zinc sigma-54-dependent two-component system n=1 Tax=Sandaracinus amylolyticus TaxID=927083 RepID=A0A0F6W7F9_9BACT|nr:sigma-54 dependent transcriptional regulator [Sandaracinus amylolyticus]AKF09361.1 Response regulator of zinc sigma-54-dependent two-component system [Sandaracinus amylolyticus]
MTRALVVDDDAGVRYTLRGFLEDAGLDVDEAKDGADALARLEDHALVITDLRMPRMDGMELLRRIKARPDAPVVVMITAHGSERQAVDAMKLGAFDYFKKPFEPDELLAVVRRALESATLRADNTRLAGELNLARTMVFDSAPMSRLAVLVQRVAPRDVTVLITGESGTGKERVAEAIVRASSRRDRPYVRFNCAAITPDLAEAELFGHAKGAFTGAHRTRAGLFREADGGTLLLDEIGEMDGRTQAKLLRVLQEGEVRPVGEDRPVAVDVRIVAATHRDLAQLVSEGKFREDLLYRLKVVHLSVPPLRERPDDVPMLFRHFLDRYEERFGTGPLRVPDGVMERLVAYRWPGNVRELENAVESLVALSSDGEIDPSLLPDAGAPSASAPTSAGLKERVEAYERGLIVAALKECGGNRSEAARRLGISRATLHEKLNKYGLGAAEE